MGFSSGFPLTNHFDLPGAQSIFGVSQDPSMCAHASLSQDGSYHKDIWTYGWGTSLNITPFGLQGAFLHVYGQGGLLTEKYVIWAGPRLLP